MSWAEFVLRSIGFKEKRKYEMSLVRIQAYESHKAQYVLSKKRPPSIDKFWPLNEKKKEKVSDKLKARFLEARQEYLKKTNG